VKYEILFHACTISNPKSHSRDFHPQTDFEMTVEMSTSWIAAEGALQHIQRNSPQIETTFGRYNIEKSQYALFAGFDESLIRNGGPCVEQIHVFTLATIPATSPLLSELGKILSPFSSLLFTEESTLSLPVYKDEEPQQNSVSGDEGNVEKKDSEGSEEKRTGRDRNNRNGGENPADASREGDLGLGLPANSDDRDVVEGPDG